MAAGRQKPSLLVIVGPTASGKSALAHQAALEFNGEIICADSRTIYKGMDIGTAKPDKKMQREIAYWGLDLVEPGQKFSAKQFKDYADGVIKEITARGKLPILVGGSGLYIDAVLYDYSFSPNKTHNPDNPRHRQAGSYAKNNQIRPNVLLVGLLPSGEQLRGNIASRSEKIFVQGVVNETKKLMLKYGKNRILSTAGIVYKLCIEYLNDSYDLAKTKELFKTADWQYARRQRTWFNRNKNISWFDSSISAHQYIKEHLNK